MCFIRDELFQLSKYGQRIVESGIEIPGKVVTEGTAVTILATRRGSERGLPAEHTNSKRLNRSPCVRGTAASESSL